jgi:hypothetical protein
VAAVQQSSHSISSTLLIRGIVLLIAAWTLLAGLALTAFHGSGASAMGAGVADEAGQRLAGAHMLVLVPVYVLIAWRPGRYGSLLWLPFFAQAAVFFAVGYSILSGDTEFGDGILAVSISGMLGGVLAFVWISQQRSNAQEQYGRTSKDDDGDPDSEAEDDQA